MDPQLRTYGQEVSRAKRSRLINTGYNFHFSFFFSNYDSRIVIVSALAHTHISGMNWDDLNWERRFSSWPAYSQSKLANILHAKELAHRLENTGISVYVLHPGMKTICDDQVNFGFGLQLCFMTG